MLRMSTQEWADKYRYLAASMRPQRNAEDVELAAPCNPKFRDASMRPQRNAEDVDVSPC